MPAAVQRGGILSLLHTFPFPLKLLEDNVMVSMEPTLME